MTLIFLPMHAALVDLEALENNMAKLKVKIKSKKSTLSESDNLKNTRVEMRSRDFLALTTNDQIMKDLEMRYNANPEKFSALKMQGSMPYLVVGEYGTVHDHEGRLRSYRNIKDNGEDAKIAVDIKTPTTVSLNDIKYLTGQYNQKVHVPVSSFMSLDVKDTFDSNDILDLGDNTLIYKPAKGQYPPKSEVNVFVKRGYNKLFDKIKKENPDVRISEVIKTFNPLLKNYSLTDEAGNRYEIYLDPSSGWVSTEFKPDIPPDVTLTLKKV